MLQDAVPQLLIAYFAFPIYFGLEALRAQQKKAELATPKSGPQIRDTPMIGIVIGVSSAEQGYKGMRISGKAK